MGRDEIELEVENAITSATLWITKAKVMHFSLVPSKLLTDGGLGLGLNSYRGFLAALVRDYLPGKKPFKDFVYPRGFAPKTYVLPLRSLRYLLTNELDAQGQVPTTQTKIRKQVTKRIQAGSATRRKVIP